MTGRSGRRSRRRRVFCATSPPAWLLNRRGFDMRKLAIGITGRQRLWSGASFLAWNADATTLTGATTARPGADHSLAEKAGCWLQVVGRGAAKGV